MKLAQRPRRNRKSASVREMVAETDLRVSQLVLPLFLCEGKEQKQAISTMPDIFSPESRYDSQRGATSGCVGHHVF